MCCCTVFQRVPLALDQRVSREDRYCSVVCRCRMESCLEVSCAELIDCSGGDRVFRSAGPDTLTVARCAIEGNRARASRDWVVDGIDSLLAGLMIGNEPAYPKRSSIFTGVRLPLRDRCRSACQSCSRACVRMVHPANKKQPIGHARHHRDKA
jgi:hypothetical protein